MREKVQMACGECKRRNYMGSRDKKKRPEKLSLQKYCRFCGKHTQHKETK